MISENAILIPSCDKYSDMWDPFFSQFWKYWQDCPYNVYLGSNYKKYNKKKVKNLLTGRDFGWGASLRKILKQIPEKYLFVWNEDLFFISPIDSKKFERCFTLMRKYNANHIHYRCLPKPKSYTKDNYLGVYEKGMPYIVNEAGFWNKSTLERLVMDKEYSWEFEIYGSYRATHEDGIYCLNDQLISYMHMCEKGRLNRDSVDFCLKNNIKIDLSARAINSNRYYFDKFRDIYFNYFLNKNWKLRVKMMNILRKIFISY